MAVQALPSSRRTSPPAWFGGEGRPRRIAPLPDWRLSRVVAYVEANLAEPISLADLAVVAGMSRMYFASQFRAATGLKPHDYVLRKRIERAQHLLSGTSEALVEVALAVGFQTQAHFTTVFKKLVGATPRRWRRQPRPLHEERPPTVPVKTMSEPAFA